MVGALVAVGQGKLSPQHIQELLELKDSRAFPPHAMAPPWGLFLKSVEYGQADFPISNGTDFPISNVPEASSGGELGADFPISNGTDFPISNGTNFLISNMTNASSGGVWGADFLISNGTDFPISNMTNASSGGVLGADFPISNGTDFLISNGTDFPISNGTDFLISNGTDFPISNGTDFLISNMTNASSGGILGADFLISNGTDFPISNVPNASSGGVLGADFPISNGTDFLISNGTNFLISNMTNASSGGVLGADFLISNGTDFPISNMTNASSGGILGADFLISNGTDFPISNVPNASSGGVLGADFLISNGTDFLISNMTNASSGGVLGADFPISNGTDFLISNMTNASSGGVLGADFLISNGTDFLISNVPEASSGGVLGADLQHSLFAASYSLVLVLGLAGSALSLSLLSCRAKPLSHSYVLLLHLGLLDALFLAVLPLHIHSQLLGDAWSFGDAACKLSGAVSSLHAWLSVAFLGCLGADAWLAALHPLASVRLRAAHYALAAAALWLLALAGTVPPALLSVGARSCFGSFPASWAGPTAPLTALALGFGVLVPFGVILLGLPLAAWSVWRRGRRGARRKALGTVSIVLGICALCFLPQQLSQLLQVLPGGRGIPQIRRVTEALASCSCCLNPLLYRFQSSSRSWRCPFRLSLRPKRVFTICDRNFGDPSWDYKPGQRRGEENPRGWNQLIHSRWKFPSEKLD
ncbi:hypothetical protein DUI87_31842 [Hirundo rustica rustica]|uniref:G-protein coupled receptors family 1 profile domain-containing protein n=1 Tax=Hirundo rustica rustica TaxID=333673 RepID=A0A3M0IY06_HIRRU|nr:hypothetical protein DUI87_31842 [Hirundo rustica rustica]